MFSILERFEIFKELIDEMSPEQSESIIKLLKSKKRDDLATLLMNPVLKNRGLPVKIIRNASGKTINKNVIKYEIVSYNIRCMENILNNIYESKDN